MFSCHLFLGIFWFPLWFLQWSFGYLVVYCLASMFLYFFDRFFSGKKSSLKALWSEKILDMISIFLNLPRLDLWPIWSILENVPWAREKKVYSIVFHGMSYKYQLSPFCLMYHLNLGFPYLFPLWMICPLVKVGC